MASAFCWTKASRQFSAPHQMQGKGVRLLLDGGVARFSMRVGVGNTLWSLLEKMVCHPLSHPVSAITQIGTTVIPTFQMRSGGPHGGLCARGTPPVMGGAQSNLCPHRISWAAYWSFGSRVSVSLFPPCFVSTLMGHLLISSRTSQYLS